MTGTIGTQPVRADVPNRELLDEAMRFAKAMVRLTEPGGGPMPYPRMRVLELLHCEGPTRMRDLADRAGLLPRNLTSVADALEEEGMVRRRPHPADRRVTLLEITPRGTDEVERVLLPRFAALAGIFDVLPPGDRVRLADYLQHLVTAMPDQRASA